MCKEYKQSTWMYIWTGLTAFFWLTYIGMRITVGNVCPLVDPDPAFNKDLYLGRWYEFYRSNSIPLYWEQCDCATATYVEEPNNYFKILNVEYCLD